MARLNRTQVIATAIEILEAGGLDALTIPSLSAKLKIRPPSLYNHIESISDLKRELSIFAMRMVCERVDAAIEGNVGDDAVVALARAYRQFAVEHPALYELSIAVPPSNDKEWWEPFHRLLRLWTTALEGYGLDRLQTRFAARATRAALHGFVNLEVSGGLLEDLDVEQSFGEGLKFLLAGLNSVARKRKVRSVSSSR